MTDRIVVGIDFSDASTFAAEWAAREMPDAELVLTHVIVPPASSAILRSRLPKADITAHTLRIGADHKLLALANSLRPRRVWPQVVDGDPAGSLSQIADAFGASMIVVGVHGDGAATSLGSTPAALLHSSRVPLVILSGSPFRPFHLLAPVDRRESAVCAVSEARRLFGDATGRLTLLHVIPGNVMKHFVEQGTWDDDTYAGEFEWVDRWSRLARDAGWPATAVRTEEVFGDPVREIRAAAARLQTDFVVMPRRSGRSLRRALLGSVTESVMRDPPCSMVVLPEAVALVEEKKSAHWRSAKREAPLGFPVLST